MLRDPLFWCIAVAVAIGMEFWAMLLHGRLWHGPWWPTHRSHHTPRTGPFELNDAFAVLHAALAIVLIIGGFGTVTALKVMGFAVAADPTIQDLLTTLRDGVILVLSFYFGSSSGSQAKDQLLHQSTPTP